MASDGVMLVPDPTAIPASAAIQANGAAIFRSYNGRIQAGLKRAFCAVPEIRMGAYRIALGLWIGPAGRVTRAVELGSTGRPEIDQDFDLALRSMSIGDPPPPGTDAQKSALTEEERQKLDQVANQSSSL